MQSKKQISDSQKIGKIIELIHLAELNINLCRTLYEEHINKDDPNKFTLTRLVANNAFNSVVAILHTLLFGSKKRELGIKLILQKENSSKIPKFEKIQNKFESYNLIKVRHQSIAHKNELLRDPAGESNLLLQEIYITQLEEIVYELRNGFCEWFNYSKHNPSLVILEEIKHLPQE